MSVDRNSSGSNEIEPAPRAALVLPPDAGLAMLADRLVEQARHDRVALTGDGGLLAGLIQQVMHTALETEMTEHLGYEANHVSGRGSGNSRNGTYPKTVRTEIGDVHLNVPRDRNATFDPVTVPKGQRRLAGLDQAIISLYAKGLTTGDIESHLEDVTGQRVPRSTISTITDAIVEDMLSWQSRPLDAVYPVLLVDGIRIKIRDGSVSNRTVYVVMGVVHLVRNSLRYASKKHWPAITRQLKDIYTAPSLEAAEVELAEFIEAWENTYPAMIKSWRDAWDDFIPFLEFPVELRKIVYSTNAIESLNSRFRKAAVRRGHFPTEQAALKVLYLVSIERMKNRSNPTGKINGWKAILNTLTIHYADRLTAHN